MQPLVKDTAISMPPNTDGDISFILGNHSTPQLSSQSVNWVSTHTLTPQNSLKFRNILRKSFFQTSAVSDWKDSWI